ncbi:MAG TPA: GTP-binding protein, partial [Thermoleophilia bacterium]|nr:GTP-binding protein [Thermoleophilia bacterium]
MNDPAKIRNIALVGHRGTGKTSLFEALLFGAGAVTRLGSVADGTTVSDWDDDEKKRQMSLSAGLAQVDHGGLSYNLVDTQGDSSFLADAIASLEVVETALMVVNTVLGVEVQTERLWDRAAERGLARMLVCNMLDRERADFDAAVAALQEAFGAQVVAVQLPIGSEHDFSGVVDLLSMKAYTYADGKGSEGEVPAELADAAAAAREKLIDAVASTDDDLAEKYLMEEEITADELNAAFAAAVATAQIFPVACVAATAGIGADRLFDVLALAPSPADVPARAVLDGEDSVELACDPSRPAVAFVFKTLADPFSGHVNVFRVFQGTMNSDSQLVVARDGHKERVGQLLRPRGKENKPVDALVAGDIGAVAKLKDVVTGDTLTAEAGAGAFPPIRFPAPLMSFAITAKSKGEEDKVISALRRLSEEDPMLEVHRDEQTGETIVGGMSQVHVEVTVERMKRRFGVEVELKPPRVPYRETIKGTAKAEGKHK